MSAAINIINADSCTSEGKHISIQSIYVSINIYACVLLGNQVEISKNGC